MKRRDFIRTTAITLVQWPCPTSQPGSDRPVAATAALDREADCCRHRLRRDGQAGGDRCASEGRHGIIVEGELRRRRARHRLHGQRGPRRWHERAEGSQITDSPDLLFNDLTGLVGDRAERVADYRYNDKEIHARRSLTESANTYEFLVAAG